jgi:hypothetical protein
MADDVRLKCVTCGHQRDIRVDIFTPPEEWMRCPNWDGPVEHLDPGKPASKEAQRRNFRKGGVLIRVRHLPVD